MIIVCNGPPGSGKDLACEILKKEGFVHVEFKKVLFEQTIKHYNVDKDWFFDGYTRERKEIPEASLDGKSRRDALIYVSEEIMKPKYGKGVFGKFTADVLTDGVDYCISDSGFVEELEEIINKFGNETIKIIRLYRNGCDFKKDSRRYIHADVESISIAGTVTNVDLFSDQFSEQPLAIKCHIIHNNGSVEDFTKFVKQIAKEF